MIQTRASSWRQLVLLSISISGVYTARHRQFPNIDLYQGSDLAFYVTRPDIRPPLWNITRHYPDEITPGYWFVSPYADFNGPPDRTEYQPCQAGPLIYDGDGNLVWSGACLDHNLNTFDFRPFFAANESRVSYVLGHNSDPDPAAAKGAGIVMDSSFKEIYRLPAPLEAYEFNLHEFQITNNGTKALMFLTHEERRNVYKKAIPPYSMQDTRGFFLHDSVLEMDLQSQKIDWQWWPWFSGVSYEESYDVKAPNPADEVFWDFYHANSIDRTIDSDYIISARHTNTIYKVYRSNNTIAWRLGGKFSDFEMDFNFSSQHDARIVFEDETMMVLTLLDNASDDAGRQNDTAVTSSAKMVALYTSKEKKTAKLLKQWNRPDGMLTRKRGNVQKLDNDNVFVCWSAQGLISEHSDDGRLLFEARFASPRFDTYRAYKSEFVAHPSEPPVVKSFKFASDKGDSAKSMVVSYVSWNGATQVKTWKFFGSSSDTENDDEAIFIQLGETEKKGFETMFTSYGSWTRIRVEGIDASGTSLGTSKIERSVFADSIAAADSYLNPAISIEKQGEWPANSTKTIILSKASAAVEELKKDPLLWIKVASAAIALTILAQALFIFLYAMWRRATAHRRRFSSRRQRHAGFAESFSLDDEYRSSGENESEPMLELRSGHGQGGAKKPLPLPARSSFDGESVHSDGKSDDDSSLLFNTKDRNDSVA